MPKRLLFVLAAVAIAVAACKSGSSSTPLPSGSPVSPSPNPSISQALVSVTVGGTHEPRIPVEISTPKNPSSPRPGKPFQVKKTGKKGGTTFRDLKPDGTYCWVALISPRFKSSECASWAIWQTSTIMLGN
ncbi:MAG: hypothetical protein JO113_00990 [Candidatus Eremiobacteraeota bacterium]|nr:hypothetical protein [Candidatus Eremiobacteraeota bacterium]